MTSPTREARAIQLVKDHWKRANVKHVEINETLEHFFSGSLYIVSIIDAKNEEHENYVYRVGEDLRRFDNWRRVGADIGESSRLSETLQKAFQFVGIPGFIAILVTTTTCDLAVFRPYQKIPELWTVLTLILGFYFGTAVRKSAKESLNK